MKGIDDMDHGRLEKISDLVEEQHSGSACFLSKWLISEVGKCEGHPVMLERAPKLPLAPEWPSATVLWCYQCNKPLAITDPGF